MFKNVTYAEKMCFSCHLKVDLSIFPLKILCATVNYLNMYNYYIQFKSMNKGYYNTFLVFFENSEIHIKKYIYIFDSELSKLVLFEKNLRFNDFFLLLLFAKILTIHYHMDNNKYFVTVSNEAQFT